MNTLQELFTDESRWTQRSLRRDAKGQALSIQNEDKATCFCLLGGVIHVYGRGEEAFRVTNKLKAVAEKLHGDGSLIQINDTLGLEAVRAICKEANV